jgi:hypothetical protein
MNISAEQTNKCVGVYTISSGENGKETLGQHVQTLHFQLTSVWIEYQCMCIIYAQQHTHNNSTGHRYVADNEQIFNICAAAVNSLILKTTSL